jgi:hypothetical protein
MIAGRVIMLSRDQGLASIVGEFVGHGRPLTRFSSPTDVRDWLRPPTGAVVLDYPRSARVIVYRQLRQRYLGPVLAVLEPDEESSGLPTDHGRIGTLQRPFTGEELSASLDALAGSRNGARRPKSRELTAPPLGADAAATAPLDVSAVFAPIPASLRARLVAGGSGAMTPAVAARAWMPTTAPARAEIAPAVVGVPATRIAGRRVAVARRRHGLAWRRMGPTSRRRVNSLVLTLAASAALVLGATLGGGGGCRPAGCAGAARAIESRTGGIAPVSPGPASPRPAAQAATGSGNGAAIKGPGTPTAADPSPGPSMVIPIASGVNDLISGTSSSSGGAPLLTVAPGPAAGGSGTGGSGAASGGGGSSGGGVPSPTTRPTTTTSPVTTTGPAPTTTPPTTAPPATQPPTTSPPPTDPPTTSPPPTDPPTTLPPTTEPPTTEPPTTEPSTTAGA